MTIGIYKVYNINNNNTYIGQSKNIENRFNFHKKDLKSNSHHCYKLQKEYNKLIKQLKKEYKDNDMYKYINFHNLVIDKYYKFEILESFNNYNVSELLTIEDQYILQYRDIKEGYKQKTNKELDNDLCTAMLNPEFNLYEYYKRTDINYYNFIMDNKLEIENITYDLALKHYGTKEDEELKKLIKLDNKFKTMNKEHNEILKELYKLKGYKGVYPY